MASVDVKLKQLQAAAPPAADARTTRRAPGAPRVDYPKLIVWVAIIVLPWATVGYIVWRLIGR